jgi:hypothetical protein
MRARTSRWALLAILLTLGVALMHTLGHPADDGAPTGMAMGGGGSHLFAASPADWMPVAAGEPALRGTAPVRLGMDPSRMCLAVLTGLLLLALATAIRRLRRRVPGAGPARRRRITPLPRGPTARPVGRAVTALSVMRV